MVLVDELAVSFGKLTSSGGLCMTRDIEDLTDGRGCQGALAWKIMFLEKSSLCLVEMIYFAWRFYTI